MFATVLSGALRVLCAVYFECTISCVDSLLCCGPDAPKCLALSSLHPSCWPLSPKSLLLLLHSRSVRTTVCSFSVFTECSLFLPEALGSTWSQNNISRFIYFLWFISVCVCACVCACARVHAGALTWCAHMEARKGCHVSLVNFLLFLCSRVSFQA